MVNRQESLSKKLIDGNQRQPFDHAITAVLLIVFGVFLVAFGSAMTGLAFAYETYPRIKTSNDRKSFVTVAMNYGYRCDIAGPILLSIGVIKILIALVMIGGFRVCNPPDRLNHKISPEDSASPLDGISIVETRFRNNH